MITSMSSLCACDTAIAQHKCPHLHANESGWLEDDITSLLGHLAGGEGDEGEGGEGIPQFDEPNSFFQLEDLRAGQADMGTGGSDTGRRSPSPCIPGSTTTTTARPDYSYPTTARTHLKRKQDEALQVSYKATSAPSHTPTTSAARIRVVTPIATHYVRSHLFDKTRRVRCFPQCLAGDCKDAKKWCGACHAPLRVRVNPAPRKPRGDAEARPLSQGLSTAPPRQGRHRMFCHFAPSDAEALLAQQQNVLPEGIVLGAKTFSRSAIASAVQTLERPCGFLYEGRAVSETNAGTNGQDAGTNDLEYNATFEFDSPWHWHYSWVGRSIHFTSTAKTRHCVMFYLVFDPENGLDTLELLEVAKSESFRIDVPGKMARKLKLGQRRATKNAVRTPPLPLLFVTDMVPPVARTPITSLTICMPAYVCAHVRACLHAYMYLEVWGANYTFVLQTPFDPIPPDMPNSNWRDFSRSLQRRMCTLQLCLKIWELATRQNIWYKQNPRPGFCLPLSPCKLSRPHDDQWSNTKH